MLEFVAAKQNRLADICRAYGVRRLELFGSAASEVDFDPDTSDLDFLVEFAPDRDLGPWLSSFFELKKELENLFARRVDLVTISPQGNPRFICEINRTRTLLYAA